MWPRHHGFYIKKTIFQYTTQKTGKKLLEELGIDPLEGYVFLYYLYSMLAFFI